MKTHLEIFKALEKGRRLIFNGWDDEQYINMISGIIYYYNDLIKEKRVIDFSLGDPERWRIVEKTYTFAEAMQMCVNGEKMRKQSWGGKGDFIYMDIYNFIKLCYKNGAREHFVTTKADIEATNWIIYNEGAN
jgi:hypothetical protein